MLTRSFNCILKNFSFLIFLGLYNFYISYFFNPVLFSIGFSQSSLLDLLFIFLYILCLKDIYLLSYNYEVIWRWIDF